MTDISIYDDINYFISDQSSIEQSAWYRGQIRYGSQCEAIAYALGFKSFEEVRNLLEYEGTGDKPYPSISARIQLKMMWEKRTREPKSVVEIGGGRGEVSCGLSYLGIKTKMIEPCKYVKVLIEATSKQLNLPYPFAIINKSLGEAMSIIDWSEVDTVILVETIEHIDPDEFDRCWPIIKSYLKKNQGYLIVTNWISYHPIPVGSPWHLRFICDEFYDELAKGGNVIFRRGSHLIVQYLEGVV